MIRSMHYCLMLFFGVVRTPLTLEVLRMIHAKKEDPVQVVHKIPSGHDLNAR